jgi:hypothetical protein
LGNLAESCRNSAKFQIPDLFWPEFLAEFNYSDCKNSFLPFNIPISYLGKCIPPTEHLQYFNENARNLVDVLLAGNFKSGNFWNSRNWNQNSKCEERPSVNFLKVFPTVIFGLPAGIGILLPIKGSEKLKNWNSQPSQYPQTVVT